MTDNVKTKNNRAVRKSAVRSFFTPRRILCLTFFIFTLVTAACRSFFGLYPFGFAAASAASGLFAAAASTAGAAAGSLLSSSSYGGYLALLSVLLFAARLLVSWWLTTDEREKREGKNRDRRKSMVGRKSFFREKSDSAYIKRENGTKSASNRGKSGRIIEQNEKIVSPYARGETEEQKKDFGPPQVTALAAWADQRLLRESVVIRMVMGSLSSLFMGSLAVAEGGFSYYDLFGAVCSVLISPILVYLIYAATERHMRPSRVREAGIYTMAALFTYALSAISPKSFDFGYAFAFAASLASGTCFGGVRGLVTGLFCGLLLEPVYAPMFSIAAGVCGLLYPISSQLAVMSALSCSIAWGIYVSGFAALSRIVPPLAMAAAVLLPLYHFDLVKLPENLFGLAKNVKAAEMGTIAEVRHRDTARHLGELSGSMKAIAQVVSALSGRLAKPTRCEMRDLCESSFERYCSRCSSRPTCYGEGYDKTASLIARLAEEVYQCGSASAGSVSPAFAKKCYHIGRILDEINFRAAERCAALANGDKLSVVAGDYEMMGNLIGESLDYDKGEMKEDGELTAKLTRLLRYYDFHAGRVTAYGVRHKRIFVSDIDLTTTRLGGDDIRRLFEEICGFPLSQPEFELDGSIVSMRIQSVYLFHAESGRASISASDLASGIAEAAAEAYETDDSAGLGEDAAVTEPESADSDSADSAVIFEGMFENIGADAVPVADSSASCPSSSSEGECAAQADAGEKSFVKEEEIKVEVTDDLSAEPCGDVISSFEADGFYYMLISDGMGSGREAALTSSVAAMFLERMLTAGASMETALKMLNKLIRAGERECSATIDLAQIDLKTGEAKFVKSGAAPSFVIRDGSIYRLQSKTVPIGIIRALDAEMIRFHVVEGDTIVMISDGVAHSFEECPWLLEMLSTDEEIQKGDPRRAAEKIVQSAAARGAHDDVTAGVLHIAKCEERGERAS